MSERPELSALAERLGILASYVDQSGREERFTSDASREALVAALGHDGSSEAAAAASLESLEQAERARILDPVQVWREHAQREPRVRMRLPEGDEATAWSLELVGEDGRNARLEGRVPALRPRGELDLPLPLRPPPGYHRLRVVLDARGGTRLGEALLVVTPRACFAPSERLGERRVFGLWANLYTLRSRRNWGFGDLGDLRGLLRFCADAGGAFVGLNPLHAIRGRGHDVSPYGPVSRLYRSLLYLDVEAVPELADCEEARALLARPDLRAALARLRAARRIDAERVLEAKLRLVEPLHRRFVALHRGRPTPRGVAYARYLEREGEALRDFATFCALVEHTGNPYSDPRHWPAGLRDAASAEVTAFRDAHPEPVDRQCWIQFELDSQLAAAEREGRDAGLPLGLYTDLAVGSAPDGADPWLFPGLFPEGVHAGAPPDDYSSSGQDWGFPPLDPHRLRADGYRYWVRLLRAAFGHARALRIDHALGLFRMFWIPAGRSGSDGAYMRYPADELLGILALESQRHRAVVVAEDLGTVPPEVPAALASWGVLSSKVLYFEQEDGAFRPSSAYSSRALVTANTHDLPPLAGFFADRDLELRLEVGHMSAEEVDEARARRDRQRSALLWRLREEGCLPPGDAVPSTAELCAAVNAFLCRTPAPLVGISLDDVAGEIDPVNLPGVPVERWPSWSRRMRLALEELASDPDVARALEGTRSRRLLRGRPAAPAKEGAA